MGRRGKKFVAATGDLNLAPLLDMIMNMIPMVLLMVQFEERAVSPVEASSSSGAPAQTDGEEKERPPRIMVSISSDGFRVADFFGSPEFAVYSEPIGRCKTSDAPAAGGAMPPTVCLQEGATVAEGDYDKLDYAGLYNRLAQIRLQPQWRDLYSEAPENGLILLSAEADVPAAVMIRTMDLTRYFLNPGGGENTSLANPLDKDNPVTDLTPYYLGGDADNATMEDLLKAEFFTTDGAEGLNRHPDGSPSNLLEMFPMASFVAPR